MKQKLKKILLKNPYFWTLDALRFRLRFKFRALFHGVRMNLAEKGNIHNFRRNVHRLEKGLSFKRMKDVFAEDYIVPTVRYLKESAQTGCFDPDTVDWGMAVLKRYFEVCKPTETVKKAHDMFLSLSTPLNNPGWTPYLEKARPGKSISYEDMYQLALRRRSVRSYLQKTVEPALIEQAMRVASLSPSACNRQSFRFLFYNDPATVSRISAVPGGIAGYEVPSLAVVVGRYRGYYDAKDVNSPIIDASLATMSFLFALESLGASSVAINWPNSIDKDKKIREIIELEPDEFVVMMIGIGYPDPDGKIPYSAKKCLSSLLEINARLKKDSR